MKRYAFIIAILLLVSLVGCSDTLGMGDANKDATNGEHAREKISGEIIEASEFSEGLAFVVTDANENVTHCINKKGEIIFTLNENISRATGIYGEFRNGVALLYSPGKNVFFMCDTSGNVTYPEDVGVTRFFDVALSEGYIIASVVTSDYASSKKELGIMDLEFQWVATPSEELEQEVSFSDAIFNNDFCGNGFAYAEDSATYLELSTGKVYKQKPVGYEILSEHWNLWTDNAFRDPEETVMLDLGKHENLDLISDFVDGKAVLVFYNRTAGKNYMTVIDEKGVFEYEPVELKISFRVTTVDTDGEYILITDSSWGSGKNAACFDMQGNLCGAFKSESKTKYYSFALSDGVIVQEYSSSVNSSTYWYLNPDFSPLF